MELTNYSDNRKRRKPAIDLSTMVYGKIPPQAKDLEEAVLGAIMLERSAFNTVYEILKPFCFYVDAHQRIFKAICALAKRNMPIDILTVVEELKINEELEIVGGPYYVTRLTNAVVSAANIEAHSRIVLQKYIQREVIRISGENIGDAYEDSTDIFDLLDNASNNLKNITNEIAETKNISITNICVDVISSLEKKVHNARNDIQDSNELYTGIHEWDKINGQLFPGVYVIAARPGMGKSNHMVQCICNMGKKYEIGILNAEMTNKQLITRIGCNLMDIDNFLWKKDANSITDEEVKKLYAAMEEAQGLRIHIEDSNYIDRCINKIKLWIDKFGVQVIFADVLSKFKLQDDKSKYMTDVQKLNYVMDAFTCCAKDLNIPIIVYAHLNRETHKRQNKEPNLSDLKGSGNIEDFAFQVSFLHRPEYYDIFEDELGESTQGLMYQIIAKHRDGLLDRLKYRALPQYSKLTGWNNSVISGWKPTSLTENPF
jgi:replicative DNA helicase